VSVTDAVIEPAFLALPLHATATAALEAATGAHVDYAAVRVERLRTQHVSLRDGQLEGTHDGEDIGVSVRVLHRGTWGFAAGIDVTPDAAAELSRQAIGVAEVAAGMSTEHVELAEEPSYPNATWTAPYDIDPFSVPVADKVALLADWSNRILADDAVNHVSAELRQVLENKFYADTAGTTTTQQRVRVLPVLDAVAVDEQSSRFETMRTLAPPVGRGWEYLTGSGWDWASELEQLPGHLAEKLAAPSVEPGTYDLVIDPSNLWLTIHESIGHATELDRALGYEANYAGTSFATPDKLGTLRYGSSAMTVTGDRTIPYGLASIGYDDEGVAAQQWDLVRDGLFVGYQLDRAMTRKMAGTLSTSRSNGCAYADSPGHVPLQRMANVSLAAAAEGPSTDELIGRVDNGIYVVGDKSWSIDMQRYNFQFTGQRFFHIRNGRLAGQVRDVAYQSNTLEFWGSLEAVGGPATWMLGGAFNCGKGQPGQVAAVSHGCPSALFRNVRILNTLQEGGR
jgi:TldD protein